MKIKAFSKSYDGRTVLSFPGAGFLPGRIYAVLGSNGSGKSTFAKILSGIIKSDSGENPLPPGITVGYMPQKSYGYRMKLISNLYLGGKDEARAKMLLEALQLTELSQQRADRLSGGETARMALARLMMKDFKLLVLDEPCASMDMESSILAEKQILRYCRESSCSLILVTHSIQQARRIADEILFFKKGVLIEQGPTEKLLNSAENEETRAFLEFYGI